MERWLLRISSSELRKHGLTVVRGVQEQLFAERFASLLKEKETKTMLSNLRVIFNADQDLDLEVGLLHFACGFSAVLNFEQWDDLGERIDLVSEGIGIVEDSLPSASSRGSAVGAVLTTWPRGKKLLDDAKARLSKAKVTKGAVETFTQKLYTLTDQMQKISASEGFIHIGADTFDALRSALSTLAGSYVEDLQGCLAEFCPSPSGILAAPLTDLKMLLGKGFKEVLMPILNASADPSSLECWLHETLAARNTLFGTMETVQACARLFQQDDLFQSIFRLRDFCLFLGSCNLALQSEEPLGKEHCMQLQKGYADCLSKLPEDIDGWGSADIECFRACPLLDAKTGVMHKVVNVTHQDTWFENARAHLST